MTRKLSLITAATTLFVGLFASSALAAPPAMTLSSFEASTTDGVIDGGTRTISVTNITDETMAGHLVELGEAPCDCVVASIVNGEGTIDDDVWFVGDLAPGATAEITFTYERDVVVIATPSVPDSGAPMTLLLGLLGAAATAYVARKGPTALGV